MRAKQYRFTLKDVATFAGKPLQRVYRDVRSGRLDPDYLPSVVSYLTPEPILNPANLPDGPAAKPQDAGCPPRLIPRQERCIG